MIVRTCNHLKEDGAPCGSPALRRKKLCYFHQRDEKNRQYAAGVIRRTDVLGPRLPHMNSLAEIQQALTTVMQAILDKSVSTRRAGRILFDLERAAIPLRHQRGSPG